MSWSEHKDPGVKYFSGVATYTKTFSLPGEAFGLASSSFRLPAPMAWR